MSAEADRPSLNEVWRAPRGLAVLSEVNNTKVGVWYVLAAFGFFLAGGILALLMRLQLALPLLGVLDHQSYNQIFTMHGTTMMFLFAVPILEGIGVYVVPQMLGARDLPFPRLSAYGFWCYVLGGLLVYSSFLIGQAPDAGWFMYPPLSGSVYSPHMGSDFWLLGLTFVEISALSAAIEITVGVIKFRPPGMTFGRIPVLAWAYLTVAWMIVFAFPPLLVADILLEAERALDWPFFDATRGGDPVLWQHLFWFFGHPEVYIIFLPAAGLISTMLPTFARRPLVGHHYVVAATIATGAISFALWVHHMFAVGLPHLSMSLFSAASMAVAIPSGIQVFAWIATLWGSRPALHAPMLFILGFLFLFVAGGVTGVMVASVPFDWQVHDTHFVVAHFHYVLIGGMVFPLFAAIYYWFPHVTGRLMSEGLARWVFGLVFVGFNLTFFPLHILGLLGMPRRVYTYLPGLGLDWLNLAATVGAFVMAAGVGLLVFDAVRSARTGTPAADNPWGAGTLEWLGPTPQPPKGAASLPRVSSLYPLWMDREEIDLAESGGGYLARAVTGGRETLRTHWRSTAAAQVVALPGPSWLPLLAAIGTGAAFTGLLFKSAPPTLAGAALAALALALWAWDTDTVPVPARPEIGHGERVPSHLDTIGSHAWWGGVVAMLIDLSAYAALAGSYVYLWVVSAAWPPPALAGALPHGAIAGGAVLLAAVAAAGIIAPVALRRGGSAAAALALGVAVALATAVGAGGALTLLNSALAPTAHAYAAVVWALGVYGAAHLLVAALISALALLRLAAGSAGRGRGMVVRLAALAWAYAAATGLASLALVAAGGG